jgi:hypothetical protein
MSAKGSPVSAVALTPLEWAAAREIVARSQPQDYDGHTEFSKMSPAERLDWLGHAALFIEESQRNLTAPKPRK